MANPTDVTALLTLRKCTPNVHKLIENYIERICIDLIALSLFVMFFCCIWMCIDTCRTCFKRRLWNYLIARRHKLAYISESDHGKSQLSPQVEDIERQSLSNDTIVIEEEFISDDNEKKTIDTTAGRYKRMRRESSVSTI